MLISGCLFLVIIVIIYFTCFNTNRLVKKGGVVENFRKTSFHNKVNDVFIETGTYHCKNARNASKVYEFVHTIDINHERTAGCKHDVPNLHSHTGKSPEILRTLLSSLGKSADFYLDAHADIMPDSDGRGTYDEGAAGSSIINRTANITEYMPLLEECKIISEHNRIYPGNYVCIDDVRCWTKPDACPAFELWRRAGITTSAILDIFDGQIQKHSIVNDQLHIMLR